LNNYDLEKYSKAKKYVKQLSDLLKVFDESLEKLSIYKQKKSKRPISGKFLLAQLEEYYKEQPELAKEITKKVLDNRIEVIKEEIKRKIDK
jgi:hypothetical protein